MHGMVISGLRSFVVDEYGKSTWETFLDRAGVDRVVYSRTTDYPDEEFLAIYGEIVGELDIDEPDIQRAFGGFLFQELADIYGHIYFEDEWGPLDMLENVEETIHQSLKSRDDATFTPPELKTSRLDDDHIRLEYGSERQFCELAKGLIDGLGSHYGTALAIEEHTCMKDGDEVCTIDVTTGFEFGDQVTEPVEEASQTV